MHSSYLPCFACINTYNLLAFAFFAKEMGEGKGGGGGAGLDRHGQRKCQRVKLPDFREKTDIGHSSSL